MSTLYAIDKYEFHNRKPSKKQIDSCVKNAMESGSKALTIIWGENQIDLDYNPNQEAWYGSGWIKDISGDDIAQELNEIREQAIAEIKQFKKDHFQFIHVGG